MTSRSSAAKASPRDQPAASCESRAAQALGANFLTRIPGAVGILWFLPRLRFGLGTDDYANLLASLALGTASAFLCGGFNTVGRRLIGEAYANNDREREANALASLLVANTGALILALAIIVACCWMRGGGGGVLVVAMLPAVATFLTTFDATRSAYNEHYVTATLLFVLQVAVYAVGFLVPTTSHSLVLGALVLQSAYVLTSLITFALLLGNRPYLVDGRPVDAWRLARKGTMLAIADGFATATLSLSVVWLQTSSSATTSAWFATVVRLFQTFLVPVVLLLMPLSSYVRILWNGKSIAQQCVCQGHALDGAWLRRNRWSCVIRRIPAICQRVASLAGTGGDFADLAEFRAIRCDCRLQGLFIDRLLSAQ
jgi:hypothetical protein